MECGRWKNIKICMAHLFGNVHCLSFLISFVELSEEGGERSSIPPLNIRRVGKINRKRNVRIYLSIHQYPLSSRLSLFFSFPFSYLPIYTPNSPRNSPGTQKKTNILLPTLRVRTNPSRTIPTDSQKAADTYHCFSISKHHL